MSEANSSDDTAQAAAPGTTEAGSAAQSRYAIQLYQGFVGRSTISPRGGPSEVLYQQTGTFHVPGGGPPAPVSNVVLTGGRHSRDVHLHIRNEPQDPGTYKGPIASVTVRLGQPGSGGPSNNRPDLVQLIRGAQQVVSIWVDVRSGGRGAASMEQAPLEPNGAAASPPEEEPEETWVIEDNASTCPRDC